MIKFAIVLHFVICSLSYFGNHPAVVERAADHFTEFVVIWPRREKTCLRGLRTTKTQPACAFAQSDQRVCYSLHA